ncbi:MAG TPA: methyl-accepting chemotaxis protein [Methylovirgula sp.]
MQIHFPRDAGVFVLLEAESFEHMKRLFINEFDDRWLQDAHDRAGREAELGVDTGLRVALWQTILQEFGKVLCDTYRFSSKKRARFLEVINHLMIFDIAVAMAGHEQIQANLARQRLKKVGNAISAFSTSMEGLGLGIAGAVDQLNVISRELESFSESGTGQIGEGGRAAEDTAFRIYKIAAAAEELAASFGEVRGQSTCSAEIARAAEQQANRANEKIWSLSEAVDKIGSVAALISYVAEQTSLLALNATVEAVRAGGAGKGFAVVANEVKLLAQQTAKATEEITRQIAVIQDKTRLSVEEIEVTGKTIGIIAEIADKVASGVEAQVIATSEIAESASRTTLNASTLAETVGKIEETMKNTRLAAHRILGVSGDLAGQAQQIENAATDLLGAIGQTAVRKLPNAPSRP